MIGVNVVTTCAPYVAGAAADYTATRLAPTRWGCSRSAGGMRGGAAPPIPCGSHTTRGSIRYPIGWFCLCL
jgi:hypothetical protein